MAKVYIGTSGYLYDHWAGVFYPEDLAQNKWLLHYIKYFDTVELNVSFYRLPTKAAFESWYKKTPKGFVFAVKGSRFITHIKRLKACSKPLTLFFSRAKALKKKLGVVLWQLPPRYKVNTKRLSDFLKLLKKYKVRNAFEFRDQSWLCEDVYKILKKHNAAFCFADYPEFAKSPPVTADFIYIRRHGAGGMLYGGNYSAAQLRKDADNIKKWLKQKKDVFIYFNNDAYGYAVKNAEQLKGMMERI